MATISELSDPDRRREFLEAFEEGDFLGLFPERCELLEGLDDGFGALVAPIFFHFAPLKRGAEATLNTKITDFELAWREALASMPTEREVRDLVCRTVAEVERARQEWLASFLPRPASPGR